MYGAEVVWVGGGVGAKRDTKRGESKGKATVLSLSPRLKSQILSLRTPHPPRKARYLGLRLFRSQYLLQWTVSGQSGLHTRHALKLAVGSRLDLEHAQTPRLHLMDYRAWVTPWRMLYVPTIVVVSTIIIHFSFFSSFFFLSFSYCFEFKIFCMESQTKHQIREKRADKEKQREK